MKCSFLLSLWVEDEERKVEGSEQQKIEIVIKKNIILKFGEKTRFNFFLLKKKENSFYNKKKFFRYS